MSDMSDVRIYKKNDIEKFIKKLENKKDSQNTTKVVTKQTFSEINTAKVTAPEGVK